MCGSPKHGGRGVIVWGCFSDDTVSSLFKMQAHLTSMATEACSDMPSFLV